MAIELTATQVGNRVRWVGALISGDYPQAKGALKRIIAEVGEPDVTGFCCLGVALELFKPTSSALEIGYERKSSALIWADDAAELFGLDTSDQNTAAEWNDGNTILKHAGVSFARIADRVAYATTNGVRLYEISDEQLRSLDDREAGDVARAWLELNGVEL